MSQPCASLMCERTAKAFCACCQQNLCLQHVNEHNAQLLLELNPLADEINHLGERFNLVQLKDIVKECREKLLQWQRDCHDIIDRVVENKCQELERLVGEKVRQQQEEVLQVQSKITKLMREGEVARHDISKLRAMIRQLQTEMKHIEKTPFRVNTERLDISDSFVHITKNDEYELDISAILSNCKAMTSPDGSYSGLANNNNYLLIHQTPNLCLVDHEMNIVRHTPWKHGYIFDMLWSSVLGSFIVIESNDIFLVNEQMTSEQNIESVKKRKWFSGACSNAFLFLTSRAWGSSIVQLTLGSSISLAKEWKSPITCTTSEFIDSISFEKEMLALVIRNQVEKGVRIELRCGSTLKPIWHYLVDGVIDPDSAYHCSPLTCDQWLMIDHQTRRFLRISADGTLEEIVFYEAKPYRATFFGSDILAVSTEKGINFHEV